MVVLGFDAREVSPRVEASWDERRRSEFLLRDVRLPLSVDEIVWPSIFVTAATAAGPTNSAKSGGLFSMTTTF